MGIINYQYLFSRIHRYGLTPKQFIELWKEQKGLCPICLRDFNHWGWVVEHDHSTGQIRSITCGSCNKLISIVELGKNLSKGNEEKYGERIRKYLSSFEKKQRTLSFYVSLFPDFYEEPVSSDNDQEYMERIKF